MPKYVFLIYSCDAHKSRSSMRLLMATTSILKLRQFVAKEIREGSCEYLGMKPEAGAKKFASDFKTKTRREINDGLVLASYDYVYDGKPI